MTKKQLAVATVLPLLFAAGVWACSSSSSSGGDSDGGTGADGSGQQGGDDGSVSGDDGSSGDDGGTVGDSGNKDGGKSDGGKKDGGGSDAAKECGAPPTFTATPATGVVCTFQADGSTPTCPLVTGEHCCIYPAKTNKDSTCNNVATACDTIAADAGLVADFECDEPGDCTAGVCCLIGNVMSDSCGHFGQAVQGTKCRIGGCQTGETVVCSAQGDCAADGGTCTGMATKGKDIGVCLP